MWSVRKAAGSAVVTALVAGGGVVVAAGPAVAGNPLAISVAAWAYTDARHPAQSYAGQTGAVPVGAWRDAGNVVHRSRAYYSFDLSALAGATISEATLIVPELAANDCATPRTVEVWRTAAFTAPTWAHAPAAEALVDATDGGQGCGTRGSWDLAAEVTAALAAGRTTLSLQLRVPQGHERDERYGRSFGTNAGISVQYNRAPNVPANVRIDGRACGAGPLFVTGTQPLVQVQVSDPDPVPMVGDGTTLQLAAWPVGDPAQRTEWGGGFGYGTWTSTTILPGGILTDDGTYALSGQATDRHGATSAWSEPCLLVLDRVGPADAPLVSSATYPAGTASGGPGVPGTFTFDANGDTEVTGFMWGTILTGTYAYVPADAPGGTATITYTPPVAGDVVLVVDSVDRAGNHSPRAEYGFAVLEP
ncbi:DNRLRE domain-containing protein [Dactylosporangium sucinum]|uniref:Uncharacterized protein n=1 Tax=Dactylosporangium sucinum TaxID=1424081 RepID=A0A917TKG2_9ACTN|nr:DNRLRE domain-containing protein [Dactylosporangium sucinum]GGM25807.1 hypothetical protein GCM10007977_028710 [Dactylosporangium sucinum]